MTSAIVELSHDITDGMVTYPGLPAPVIGSHLSFDDSVGHYAAGTEFSIATLTMVANTGTYLDTPAHRYRGGRDLATLPIDRMVNLRGLVLDLRHREGPGIDELPLDGVNLQGRAVLIFTGHSAHWGTQSYADRHPHLTAPAVQQLVDAKPALVGIDSLNIDGTATGQRIAHSELLARGIPIVEHLTNLSQLPPRGFRFFAAPPKIHGMGTFPVRAFALVESGGTG